MASRKCSNCGLVNFATETNCKRCSAPLAPESSAQPPYGSGMSASYPPPPDAYYPQTPASPAEDDYVFPPPPSIGLYPQGGVWRDQSTLVMSKDAVLPDRCVKCNSPANGLRLKRTLYWHNPIFYVLIFVGVLIYFIVAMLVRKTAIIDVPLCENHLARRRNSLIVGWVLMLLGIIGFVLAIAGNEPIFAAIGALAMLFGFVLAISAARTVLPKKIDDRFVWLKGINKDYLDQLPQWAGLS
jgi:hypothetical protein